MFNASEYFVPSLKMWPSSMAFAIRRGLPHVAHGMTGGFNQPDRAVKPIPVGELRPRTIEPEREVVDDESPQSAPDSLVSIASSIRESFSELIDSEQLRVSGNELWIEIEL